MSEEKNRVNAIFMRETDGGWHTVSRAERGDTCRGRCSLYLTCDEDEGELDQFCGTILGGDLNFGPATKEAALEAWRRFLGPVPSPAGGSGGKGAPGVGSVVVVSGGRAFLYRRRVYSCDKCALAADCDRGLSPGFKGLCVSLLRRDGSFAKAGRSRLLDIAEKEGL